MDSRIREDIVDRGIERGEWEMRNLGKQLGHDGSDQEPHADGAGEISKDDIRKRKVDPEAVRESFKEAELDPTTERELGEGKPAA